MDRFENYGIQIPYGRHSGQIKLVCPKCKDTRGNPKDKSLSVSLDKGTWYCHHCSWTGCLKKEKEPWEMGSYDYRKAEIRHKQRKTYSKPKQKEITSLSDKVTQWFKEKRGISEKTLIDLKITEGVEWMPGKGVRKSGQWNTIQFNYFKNGELVNVKYRTGFKSFKFCKDAEILPYNIDNIKGEESCIITEGEMDTLSFWEIGHHNCISVPSGGGNTNLDWLDDYIDEYFDDKKTIYIASDTDTVGVKLKNELIRRFGAERCKILDYGEKYKDANELLVGRGKEALKDALKNAQDVKVEGIFTVKDFEQELDEMMVGGLQRGVTIGFDNFDRLCSFETKRLCIVTGIPGSGKSEFIDEIAERLNMRYGWRFAYFSPENLPLKYHAAKLIEKLTGKKAKLAPGYLTQQEYKEVKEHLQEDFSFIVPSDYKLDTILERGVFLVKKRGIKCLVIDPYNRLEDEQGAMSETRYVSHILDRLQNFAQRNDVLVILMAHPTKMPRDKEGKTIVPTLYDISGSANFYNKADFGIVVHRDRQMNCVNVIVQKVKFRHLGEPGTALFKYNLNNGRYVPYEIGMDDKNILWDNTNHLTEARHQKEATSQQSLNFDMENSLDDMPFGGPLENDSVPF